MNKIFVPLLLLSLLLSSLTVPSVQDTSPNSPASAIGYLVTNYNRTIGLIPETPGGNTYWIYSDNLLASIILSSHPENKTLIDIASNITTTMDRYTTNLAYGVNQYMIFYSGIGAFNISSNYNIAQVSGATINTTLNNGTSPLDPSSYGDIAFLKAIYCQYRGDYYNATKYFQLGYNMYDGKGIEDTFFTSGSEAGIYQTYKLALFILATKVLRQALPENTTSILLSQQAASGGFITGYSYQGGSLNSVGATNTETTSLAMLAISQPPSPTKIADNANLKIPVGSILYVWYGFNTTSGGWTGGIGSSHWNYTRGETIHNSTIVKDTPSRGYYSSISEMSRQLALMQETGFNYVLVSWWGWGVTNFSEPGKLDPLNAAINQATFQAFRAVENMGGSFKIALLVEPFAGSSVKNDTNYNRIYDYVWRNFYQPYDNTTLSLKGNPPLLLWFNPSWPTPPPPDNPHFTSRIVGNDMNYNMTNHPLWIWTRAPDKDLMDFGGWGDGKPNKVYLGETDISRDGFVSVIPRYDDFYLYPGGRHCGCYMRFDYDYSRGLYEHEWHYVIQQSIENPNVRMILINSWNEYHERSAIEPHSDFSNQTIQDNYLQDKTRNYVSQLNHPMAVSTPLASPPSDRVDIGQLIRFTASVSGGSGEYHYFWSGLPPGCSGHSIAVLTCSPTIDGTFIVTVNVTDTNGYWLVGGPLPYTINTNPVVKTPFASKTSVDKGQNVTFTAYVSGGSGGYSYKWIGLPAGCTSESSPSLTCTPSETGNFSITVNIVDSNGYAVTSEPLPFIVSPSPSPPSSYAGIGVVAILVLIGVSGILVLIGIGLYRRRDRIKGIDAKARCV